ncbi:uncharacterized protein F4807DRAFT_433543 [Annulohypoxylon truncatum]|uniref:uncharacterized protein n=1 Tax=Annulohypoxylon truncatum TaxID=327061 RepID=UPI0020073045|nr:uncharacterized protein F4807DRAFT_433543 [Annulohypoxylon truncatum]KAI1207863.1 hypothetical protein F4807DRAFT_433543 [Annulohypoxylon truncatum]
MNPEAFSFEPSGKQDRIYRGELPLRPRDPSRQLTGPDDSRSKIPCRFFLQGQCLKGNSCPFLHKDNSEFQASAQIPPSTLKSLAPKETTRSIKGGLIHFKAGAAVSKASLSSDFSAVQISQLPRNSTRESVLALLRSHGFALPNGTDVRMTTQGDHSSALVKVEDSEFAKSVGRKFGPQTISHHARDRQPIATPIENPILSDSNTLRVDCKKVHVSWHRPYKTVWLNFGNKEVAERVKRKFTSERYKILNQKVQSGEPTRGLGSRNPLAWTVCLTEVPASATKSDVSNAILFQSDKPRNIELGKPTYSTEAETCSAIIQSLFTSIGPLEWWEFTPDNTGKRMKASGRFQNEDDAREAVQTLNKSELPFNKKAKLTVQLVHMAKFKVAENIYVAVESQLMANLKGWKASHLQFTAYGNSDPPKWYRVLKIEGEGDTEVANAKNTITDILSGMIAKKGSSILWHPALCRDGPLFKRLESLGQKIGVVITRNKVKSQLRLYGSRSKCETGQADIARLLNDEHSELFNLDLDPLEFGWVLRGGLVTLENEIGPEKVNFDITSTPKHVVIVGTVGDYDKAIRVLKNKETTQKKRNDPNNQECSVCWGEAENPIQTQCDHTYCLDCFENLCVSSTTKEKATQICCVGEAGNCSKILGLPELQEHLSSTAFEELLEQSFASYVRLHPESLRYCPSVDCGYVYRISATPKMRTCPQCLVPVCTACHAQHGTMTCADYKDLSTGGYAAFETLKKEIGIKDCPKCKTPLEKTEGCNHMACRCGAHICWVCLKIFETATPCYTHMNKEHRGIGFDDLQERFG